VHHQLQQLGDIGLERAAFGSAFLGHRHGGSRRTAFVGVQMEAERRRFKI
jgi:hypothetical protein